MESPVVAWNREHLSYETDPQNDKHNQLRAFMWNNSTPWEKPLKNLFIMQKSGVSHSMTARLDLGTPLKIHFQEFEAPLGNRNRAEESWAVSYLAPTDSRHRQTQHNLNFAESPHCQHEKTLLRNPTAFSSSCNTGRIAFHGRGWREPTYVVLVISTSTRAWNSHLSSLAFKAANFSLGLVLIRTELYWQQSYTATMATTDLLTTHSFVVIGMRESYGKSRNSSKK